MKLGKEDDIVLLYSQLEIDHVTQKPKETSQSTCGGPRCMEEENYQTNSKTEVDSYRESFCVFRKLFSLKHQNGER